MSIIDYGNLIFSKRHEIDKKAYSKYNDNFDSLEVEEDEDGDKYATMILRKEKLLKIKKADI